jgi:hypothetical protein
MAAKKPDESLSHSTSADAEGLVHNPLTTAVVCSAWTICRGRYRTFT